MVRSVRGRRGVGGGKECEREEWEVIRDVRGRSGRW